MVRELMRNVIYNAIIRSQIPIDYFLPGTVELITCTRGRFHLPHWYWRRPLNTVGGCQTLMYLVKLIHKSIEMSVHTLFDSKEDNLREYLLFYTFWGVYSCFLLSLLCVSWNQCFLNVMHEGVPEVSLSNLLMTRRRPYGLPT